jgi:hypothetical protein
MSGIMQMSLTWLAAAHAAKKCAMPHPSTTVCEKLEGPADVDSSA